MPAYFYREGFYDAGTGVDGTRKFQIYFQGGAWCAGTSSQVTSANSMDSCNNRARGYYGSSSSYTSQVLLNTEWFAVDQEENPLFYNWNTIWRSP